VLERFYKYVDNIEEDKLLHDFIGSSFIILLKKFYFILTSCFVLTAVRIKVVLTLLKNGKVRKSSCYQIFCKKSYITV